MPKWCILSRNGRFTAVILPVVLLVATIAILRTQPWAEPTLSVLFAWLDFAWFDLQRMQIFLSQFGAWTPAVSFALMVLQAVIPPLPTTPIAAANGMLYGIWPGALLSWSGALVGAAVSYGIARHWGAPAVTFFFGDNAVGKLAVLGSTRPFLLVLVARLTPVLSLDVVAYWAGLSRMNFSSYLLATAIGQAPHMLAYAVLGNDLAQAQLFSWRLWLIVVAAIVLYFGGRHFFTHHPSTEEQT